MLPHKKSVHFRNLFLIFKIQLYSCVTVKDKKNELKIPVIYSLIEVKCTNMLILLFLENRGKYAHQL